MNPKKIFVVDDADFMVDMLCTILKEAGHRIVGKAFDGEAALKSIQSLRKEDIPDIVTIDFNMPKMDGLETGRKIRRIVPGVKIFLISSHATRPIAVMARECGVDAFIVKPFEPQTLLTAIDSTE